MPRRVLLNFCSLALVPIVAWVPVIHWGDTHLNEAGHEVMATQVAAWIAPWLESELEAR